MNNVTLNPQQTQYSSLNISRLKQSEFSELYNDILEHVKGALTMPYGDDVGSIFLVGHACQSPNEIQADTLRKFQQCFEFIEKSIDPERLKFSITKAADEEICLNRPATSGGRVKLIVHDDGVIALSYLPKSADGKILEFYNRGEADFEALTYSFFKY